MPVWGLLLKNKEKKFEGIFSFRDNQKLSIYDIKSDIVEFFNVVNVEGWCYTDQEKILAKFGQF